MTINLNPRLRLALYLLTILGTPVVVYLKAKGIIGDLELILWGAEVTAVSGLAALNVGTPPPAGLSDTDRAELAEYQRLYADRAATKPSEAMAKLSEDLRESTRQIRELNSSMRKTAGSATRESSK